MLLVAGAFATLIGLVWIGQGVGLIRWPAASSMIDQRVWADRGAAMAVAGLLMVLVGRRLRR